MASAADQGRNRMSLGIVFKGPEGLVLAADSRVTLTYQATVVQAPGPTPTAPVMLVPAFYDNATKLLRAQGQDYVAAVTYGLGAIGQNEPRTAHSFIPEFEASLATERLSVEEFARRLGQFFVAQFQALMPGVAVSEEMYFLVGGYNEGESYGRIYLVSVPNNPAPVEQQAGTFGIAWGGQVQITQRILNSFDVQTMNHIKQKFGISDTDMQTACQEAMALHGLKIPYQFLPLQDCVDLSILLIKTTSQLMQYVTDIRGVGGAVDVATITRTEGCQNVQTKRIHGEQLAS
jgi:hypothetical protein